MENSRKTEQDTSPHMAKELSFLGNFLPLIKKGFFEFRQSYKRLKFREIAQDFFSVLASVGFVAIPAFLIGFLFLLLPQGRDTLLLVTENLSNWNNWNPFPLFFLILSVFFWSIASELSVRYSIYVSDNSGKSLKDDRVSFRKTVQKFLAACFLLWPYVVVMSALVWNMLLIVIKGAELSIWAHVVTFMLVYGLMVLKTNLYFGKTGKASRNQMLKTRLGARSLPAHEYRWVQKLYGIYNDYVFTLPKYTNFVGSTRKNYRTFANRFLEASEADRDNFPKAIEDIESLRQVPQAFELINSENIAGERGDLYKWIYKIPTSFYGKLHKKVVRMGIISILVIILIALCPVKWGVFSYIGAPALICGAFGCYSGLYCLLLYLDKGLGRGWWLSVRLVIAVLFIVTVFWNQDHPARIEAFQQDQRPTISHRFSEWLVEYRKHLGKKNGERVPVFFVCAEGGAFRTGAYTSLYLTTLEQQLSLDGIDFHKSVFAMSGVSGGAVGLGYYNATAFKERDTTYKADQIQARNFFAYDCLSPVVAKMLYGEFINLFIPWHIQHFDRAIALETSWEMAYSEIFPTKRNAFSGYFLDEDIPHAPLFIINTTEAESGMQCWISSLNSEGQVLKDDRDLLSKKVGQLNYSTAINFSSRFPLFSPGAKVENGLGPGRSSHYVDGGYVENTGAASMLEVLKILKKKNAKEYAGIYPIVIQLLFSDSDAAKMKSIKVGNEFTEVVGAIYNTRSGRSQMVRQELKTFLQPDSGYVIRQPLLSSKVPMNWVLSESSMRLIQQDIDKKFMDDSPFAIVPQLPIDKMKRSRSIK